MVKPQKKLVIILAVLLVLSLYKTSMQLPTTNAEISTLKIVNIQTLNNTSQSCFYFCRGTNSVTFDISIKNSGSSAITGQLTITMIDNGRVPVENLQSQVSTINPGQTTVIRIISNVIPTYAFVGIASAQVIFKNLSSEPLDYSNINYYIGFTVNPMYMFSGINIIPTMTSIIAGNSVNYTAVAYDPYGDYLDISYGASWSITPQAGGLWTANLYTASKSGIWNVTALIGTYSAFTSITVNHASAASVILSPQRPTIVAGQSQTFSAKAYDLYGNSWDVTGQTSFSTDSQAQGSWSGNVFTAGKTGVWTILATVWGVSSQTSITVTHAAMVSLTISPESINLTSDMTQTYLVSGSDFYNNSWDVTASSVFSINSSAGGFWSNNNYTTASIGKWIITSTNLQFQCHAQLTVFYPIDFYYLGKVNFNDILYFNGIYINYYATGIIDKACDLNHDGALNFNDILMLVGYYNTYANM